MQLFKKWRWAVLRAILALGLIGATNLNAQEVLVGKPRPYAGEASVDTLPEIRGRLSIKFPKEMVRTDEIGYALFTTYVRMDKEYRYRVVEATVHPYRQAVAAALMEARVRPARRGGQEVGSWFWLPVIFNPASSAEKLADATPRLLELTPIIGPEVDELADRDAALVGVKVNLDERGQVVTVTPNPNAVPEVQAAIQAAMRAWKFAPARWGGQAVAGEVGLKVLVQPPLDQKIGRATRPVPIAQPAPVYPPAMAGSGLIGEVTLRFVINAEGRVERTRVVTSNNPGFNSAALAAVTQWRFKPAMMEGRPVSIAVAQMLEFQIDGGGTRPFAIEKAPKAKTAEENALRPDVPPQPHSVAWPVYPYALLREKIAGSARVKLIIDQQGQVLIAAPETATHPEFGFALAAAAEHFRFAPALKDGKPVLSSMGLPQDFEFQPSPVLLAEDIALLELETKTPEAIITPKMLDAPIAPRVQGTPKYPQALLATGGKGEVVVEFLIDTQGQARLPRIVSATLPEFGYAAVQAVAGWQFAPPVSKGKPVVVRVRVPLEFMLEGNDPTN